MNIKKWNFVQKAIKIYENVLEPKQTQNKVMKFIVSYILSYKSNEQKK